jgi:hypothetical protein
LIRATDVESEVPPALAQHAFSLRFGLPPVFETFQRQFGYRLNRQDYRAFHRDGINSTEELRALPDEDRERLLRSSVKAGKINELLNHIKEEVDMQSATVQTGLATGQQPQLVEIDGAFEGDRFLVRINGYPVRLTGKSFKYLAKLAWSRLHKDAGWIYKEDIEVGFNQARYLYRMKNEINSGFHSGWPIVENNRLGYYRLQIDPSRIRLNVDTLKNHPDYEVRSLFEARQGEAVN